MHKGWLGIGGQGRSSVLGPLGNDVDLQQGYHLAGGDGGAATDRMMALWGTVFRGKIERRVGVRITTSSG
jgi:hypothetical protein